MIKSGKLSELFCSQQSLPTNELWISWMIAFKTLRVILRKVFGGKQWTNLSADVLRVTALLFRRIPKRSKVTPLKQ